MAARRSIFTLLPVLALALFIAVLLFAKADDPSYKVSAARSANMVKPSSARLTVHGAKVTIIGGDINFQTSCSDFVASVRTYKSGLEIHNSEYAIPSINSTVFVLVSQEGVNRDTVLQQTKDACATQQAQEREQLQRDAEAEAARQAAVELEQNAQEEKDRLRIAKQNADYRAERVAELHDAIFTALHAAEEPDPFASIRGEFDFSASDSRQWRTDFKLPEAERCVLIRAPAPTPVVGSVWTLACVFSRFRDDTGFIRFSGDDSGDGYKRVVEFVKGILKLPYEPDEQAPLNINQVFFADPSRPAWRLFVSKLNEESVGISVAALHVADQHGH